MRAASVLLPTQADSSTYPWYSESTCPRRLLYHLFEAPVLGPWAHLGFEKKRPQSLNKRTTKAWGTNRHGLDVKLLSISRKTGKAPVANHNGLDAKLLRSSWKTTKAWVANHNGLDAKLLRSSWKTTKAWVANHNGLGAKLLRMSLKIQEEDTVSFILWSIFLVVLRPSQYELQNRP